MKKADLAKALALLRQGDWQAAHAIVQKDEDSPLACWAHGIVHLMEGDTSNARYWYREAKREFPRQPSIADEIAALSALVLRSRGTQE
jgi:Flp pilus assembly protein TadD